MEASGNEKNWSNYCILEISVSSTRRKTDKHPDMVLQHLHYNVNIMVTILKTFSFLQLQRASNLLYFVLRKHTGNFLLPSYSLDGVTEGIFILRNTLESLYTKVDLEKGPAASLC